MLRLRFPPGRRRRRLAVLRRLVLGPQPTEHGRTRRGRPSCESDEARCRRGRALHHHRRSCVPARRAHSRGSATCPAEARGGPGPARPPGAGRQGRAPCAPAPSRKRAPCAARSPGRKPALPRFVGEYFSIHYPRGWRSRPRSSSQGAYLDTTIRHPSSPVDLPARGRHARVAAPTPPSTRRRSRATCSARTRTGGSGSRARSSAASTALRWDFDVVESGVRLRKVDVFLTDGGRNRIAVLTQAPARRLRALRAAVRAAPRLARPAPRTRAEQRRVERVEQRARLRLAESSTRREPAPWPRWIASVQRPARRWPGELRRS